MKRSMLKLSMFSLVLSVIFMTSCTQDGFFSQAFTGEVGDYVDQSIYEIEERGNMGRFGCYDLVFPISINFPDGSTADVEDYEGFRATISDWKEANPDAEERPTLVFPIEVTTDEGELITVEDRAGLGELKRECKKDFFNGRRGHRGHGERCGKCFSLVFPVSLAFPDGTTTEAADREALKMVAREWKRANPDAEERPSFVFPIQVELTADESVVDLADADALTALREECKGDN